MKVLEQVETIICEHKDVKKQLQNGYSFEAAHPYQDKSGKLLFYKVRLKHPSEGKWIRFFHMKEDTPVLGKPDSEEPDPLYKLPDILDNPNEDVWVVEGENCADALSEMGLVATTSGSCKTCDKADWNPLKDRNVIVWPDNDQAGINYAIKVTQNLLELGCSVQWVDLSKLKAKGE
jgi:5S rRNA maturation endonuclease (ribonuclease M5)